MIKDEDILNKLKKEIEIIEDKIKNPNLYNKKNRVIRKALKSAIMIDNFLPYILSGVVLLSSYKSAGKTPFLIDTVTQKSYIEMIDTSNGDHFQYQIDSNEVFSSIEYSTGWRVNGYGLYERISTTYLINENIDLNNIDNIFKMSKGELDSTFFVMETQIITEAYEENLDPIYNEEVIVINRVINTNKTVDKEESFESNFLTTSSYLAILFIVGTGLKGVKEVLCQEYIKNNLEVLLVNYQELDENTLEKLKKILELKKENFSLLCESGEEVHGKKLTR